MSSTVFQLCHICVFRYYLRFLHFTSFDVKFDFPLFPRLEFYFRATRLRLRSLTQILRNSAFRVICFQLVFLPCLLHSYIHEGKMSTINYEYFFIKMIILFNKSIPHDKDQKYRFNYTSLYDVYIRNTLSP